MKRRKGGKIVASTFYHGEYTDAKSGKRVRRSLRTRDKQVAEVTLRKIILDQQRVEVGILPQKSLRDAAQRSIVEHLHDYQADLSATERSDKYVYNVGKRIEKPRNGMWLEKCSGRLARLVSGMERKTADRAENEERILRRNFRNAQMDGRERTFSRQSAEVGSKSGDARKSSACATGIQR